MKQNGFALLEIVVAIIIIGILSGIALLNFSGMQEKALGNEAKANLKLIAAAERNYRMESADNSYSHCHCEDDTACNMPGANNGCNWVLNLSLSPKNWSYWVLMSGAGDSAYFVAYADRKGTGGYLDCRYNLASNDSDGEPDASECP